jgi:hypothetical protein
MNFGTIANLAGYMNNGGLKEIIDKVGPIGPSYQKFNDYLSQYNKGYGTHDEYLFR